MTKKRVLVTGSSGFLGKNISEFLKKKGWQVFPFDKLSGQDLMSPVDLKKALSKVDYVCHLAAVGDVYLAANDPVLAAQIGVGGTANLVKVANELGTVKKIVYASTWEVYGHPKYQPLDEKHPCYPDHPYSASKFGGELMIRSKLNNVPWNILRLGSAYGRYMRSNAVIPLFINKAKNGEEITISGNGSQIRQFTYAFDIARAFELAMLSKIQGEVFNVVSPETQTIRQIADTVNLKIAVKIVFGPKRQGDVSPAEVSSVKAKMLLGWSAKTKFKQGFEDVFRSLNE